MFSPLQTQWVHNEQSSKRLSSNLLIYLAAPQGFEPRYADPESAVLPLNEGAVWTGESRHVPALFDFMVRDEERSTCPTKTRVTKAQKQNPALHAPLPR